MSETVGTIVLRWRLAETVDNSLGETIGLLESLKEKAGKRDSLVTEKFQDSWESLNCQLILCYTEFRFN